MLRCVRVCGNRCSLRMAENFSSQPEMDRSGRKVSAIANKSPFFARSLAPTGLPADRPADQPTIDWPIGQPTDRLASWAADPPAGQPTSRPASQPTHAQCACSDSLQRCSEVQPWVVLISPWRPPEVPRASPGNEMHDLPQWTPLPNMSCSSPPAPLCRGWVGGWVDGGCAKPLCFVGTV